MEIEYNKAGNSGIVIHMKQVDGGDDDIIITAEINGVWQYLILHPSLWKIAPLRRDHCSFPETSVLRGDIGFSGILPPSPVKVYFQGYLVFSVNE